MESKTERIVHMTETVPIARIEALLRLKDTKPLVKGKLRAYKKQRIGKTDEFKVTYTFQKLIAEEGRVYAKGCQSLQNFDRNTRNFLAEGTYQDIDMVNAIPSILASLVRMKGLLCPNIIEYVADRAKVLAEVGAEKQDVLKLIFKSGDTNSTRHPFLKALHKEIYGQLVPALTEEHADIWTTANEVKKYNVAGSFLSRVGFYYENIIIQAAFDFIVENGLKPDVLMFDGLMVQANDDLDCEFFDAMTFHIKEKTGFSVAFVDKKLESNIDTAFKPRIVEKVPDDEPFVQGIVNAVMACPINHHNVAEIYLQLQGNAVMRDAEGNAYVVDNRNIWSSCGQDGGYLGTRALRTLQNFFWKYAAYIENYLGSEESAKEFTKKIDNMENLLGQRPWSVNLAKTILTLSDPMNGIEDIFISKPYLVAFTDCVYDLRYGTKRPIRPEDYICFTTGYPFPTEKHEETTEAIKRFFHSIFAKKEIAEFNLKRIASALYGARVEEVFFTHEGKLGRNGKSKATNLIHAAFGDYAFTLDKNILTKESGEGDKPNTQLVKLRGKRYISSSEPSAKDRLCAALIKLLTGGEPITVRGLHKACVSFQVVGMINILANHPSQMDSLDRSTAERSKVLVYPYTFLSNPSETDKREKLIDKSLGEKFRTTVYRDNFMLLLLEIFAESFVITGDNGENKINASLTYPYSVLRDSQRSTTLSMRGSEWFLANYKLTGNDKDRVKRAYVWASFDLSQEGKTDLRKMKQKQLFTELDSAGCRTIKSDGVIYYKGILERTPEEKAKYTEDGDDELEEDSD